MRRSVILGILSVAATLVVAAPAHATTSCTWTWTDLPVPANKLSAQVRASDGNGTYVGDVIGSWPQKREAVVWQNGTVTSLGAAFGADTTVLDINSNGVVVGEAGGVPVRYRAGQWERLPIPTGFSHGTAMHVNDNGDIAGAVGIGRLVLWPATGGYELLTAPIVTTYAEPTDIASDGTVSFWIHDSWYHRSAGFLRRPDGTWIRAAQPNPTDSVFVQALNDDLAVGTAADTTMVEWDRTGTVVRTYPGVRPLAVNAAGQILGSEGAELGIWRSGTREAQLPSTIDGVGVEGIAVDDDSTVIGQRYSSESEASRPVVARCG